MSGVVIRMFGECVVEIGEHRLTPAAPHMFAAALYLGMERGRQVPRRDLESLLFPRAQTPRHASHSLRQLLYRLRQCGMPLVVGKETVGVATEEVEDRLSTALEQGYQHRVQSLLPADPAHYGLEALVSPGFAEWMESMRDHARHRIKVQLVADIHVARRHADWPAVSDLARRCLEIDPLNETATLGLAESLARQGSKATALELLATFAEEVGIHRDALSLPARLLRRRISENIQPPAESPFRLPFVGRGPELDALHAAWERAREGRFVLLSVCGEIGIGKTRLVEEFLELVAFDNGGLRVRHLLRRGDALRPVAVFADICPMLLALPGAAGCAPDTLPLLRQLSAHSRSAARGAIDHNEATFSEAQIRYAIGDLVDSVASERPLLILIDNADWMDNASRDLLLRVQQSHSEARVMVVLCHSVRSMVLATSTQISVGPLDAESTTQLAAHAAHATHSCASEPDLEWCVAACGGNPAHLELLVRHRAMSSSTDVIPQDMVHLLDESLHVATPPGRLVVQAVAVFGPECRVSDLASLTGLGPDALLQGMHDAEDASLVQFADGVLTCRSTHLGERALHLAPPAFRAMLHLRSAELLSQREGSGAMSQSMAWRIAEHWTAAGEVKRALAALRDCWRHTVNIGQPFLAADNIRRALTHPILATARRELLDELVLTLESTGEPRPQMEALEERIRCAVSLGEAECVRMELAFCVTEAKALTSHDPSPFVAQLRSLLREHKMSQHRLASCARLLLLAANALGDRSLADEAVAFARDLRPNDARAEFQLKTVHLIYHTHFGDRATAVSLAESMENDSRTAVSAFLRMRALTNCSLARNILTDLPPSIGLLSQCVELCLKSGMTWLATLAACRIAEECFEAGWECEALTWTQKARDIAQCNPEYLQMDEYLDMEASASLFVLDVGRAEHASQALALRSREPFSRAQQTLLARQICLRAALGKQVANAEEIASLARWHELASRYGRHDDVMEALWLALNYADRQAEAHSLLAHYLSVERREIRPPNYMLRRSTSTDPFWAT